MLSAAKNILTMSDLEKLDEAEDNSFARWIDDKLKNPNFAAAYLKSHLKQYQDSGNFKLLVLCLQRVAAAYGITMDLTTTDGVAAWAYDGAGELSPADWDRFEEVATAMRLKSAWDEWVKIGNRSGLDLVNRLREAEGVKKRKVKLSERLDPALAGDEWLVGEIKDMESELETLRIKMAQVRQSAIVMDLDFIVNIIDGRDEDEE